MDFFIKKIFDGRIDDSVHLQFQKFSKGIFKDRASVYAKKSLGNYFIGTSYEYANELVKAVAEKLKDGEKVEVFGAIITTRDLSKDIEFKDKKQFQGVKRYIFDDAKTKKGTLFSKKQILDLCNNFPKSFLALSFKTADSELKIKPKPPKSGKPTNKSDDEPKVDFCKLKTTDYSLVNGLIFDSNNFKIINIKHDFIINEIEIPKGINDPAEMREKAIRKGKIIRYIDSDGKEFKTEKNFSA
ncbi:MAG: hypothetical protein QXH60_01590 [Candidatus Pacearchaeota archaeon]